MAVRWDSLLARDLAHELDARLGGARLRAVRLDGDARDMALLFRDGSLVWRLHPERSSVLLRPAVEPAEGDHRLRARLRAVVAPPDERIVRFELVGERKGVGAVDIVVELIGNKLNAAVVDASSGAIRHVLVRRGGRRPFAVGSTYAPPEPTGRLGIDGELTLERWTELLEPVPPPDRARELVSRVAWTSPLNAAAFLEPTLEAGHRAWQSIVEAEGATRPVVLETDRGPQPYPFHPTGTSAKPMGSLLEAIEESAVVRAGDPSAEPALAVAPGLLARLDEGIERMERRRRGLAAELHGQDDPHELRATGDLILARFSELPSGVEQATLTGFDGAPVTVTLDPARAPHEQAAAYYDRAGRAERAAEKIPRLMDELAEKVESLRALRERAVAGDALADEIRQMLPVSGRSPARGGGAPTVPYRTFRSSGGLEIRVGRGAKHNDDLTFRHSAPNDVWLHARHTAGAHVILRWQSDDNPPAKDLAQAGALAALHSKARTSTSVPIDWTRRKHVRKPRGSAPGSVLPDRVQTIFVRPDEELLEALADEP